MKLGHRVPINPNLVSPIINILTLVWYICHRKWTSIDTLLITKAILDSNFLSLHIISFFGSRVPCRISHYI